jgi:hypothetical protein
MRRGMLRGLDAAAGVWARRHFLDEATGPAVGMSVRSAYLTQRARVLDGRAPFPLDECGFRVFSQFDEDGVLVHLLGAVGTGPRLFVDIGGGDGITASNIAVLAFHLGFHGLVIDANDEQVRRGAAIYARHPATMLHPPVFRSAIVTPANVNGLIESAGITGEIDVLSIDIDGNDFWVWEAIRSVRPRIVIMETHPELGAGAVVVPYRDDPRPKPGEHPGYMGASPAAMTDLAERLGYRLVAGNMYGFNCFYLRNDLADGVIPSLALDDLLRHPRNRELIGTAITTTASASQLTTTSQG